MTLQWAKVKFQVKKTKQIKSHPQAKILGRMQSGKAGVGNSSQDVVQRHKGGEERTGDLRSGRDGRGTIDQSGEPAATRKIDNLGGCNKQGHNLRSHVEDTSSRYCPFNNLSIWCDSEDTCQRCDAPNPRLQHILASCKGALAQGRCRWQRSWRCADWKRTGTTLQHHSGWSTSLVREVGHRTSPGRRSQPWHPGTWEQTSIGSGSSWWRSPRPLCDSLSWGRKEHKQPSRGKRTSTGIQQLSAERQSGIGSHLLCGSLL